MKKLLKCAACEAGKHTSPPAGSPLCQCGRPTCACYGLRKQAEGPALNALRQLSFVEARDA